MSSNTAVRILSALLHVGLGTGLGFLVFYFAFQAECSKLVHQIELNNSLSVTSQRMEIQQQQMISNCPDRDAKPPDQSTPCFSMLQELLDAQAVLTSKHHSLLVQHEATINQLSELKSALDSATQTVSSHNQQIKRLQRELGQSTVAKVRAEQQMESMRDELQIAQIMLKQKVKELTEIHSSRSNDQPKTFSTSNFIARLTDG